MGEGVDEDAVQGIGIGFGAGLAEGRGEQGTGFEGGVFGVGQVEKCERGAGLQAEPAFEEGRHRCGRRGPEFNGDVVLGEGPGGEVGAGVGRADGDREWSGRSRR